MFRHNVECEQCFWCLLVQGTCFSELNIPMQKKKTVFQNEIFVLPENIIYSLRNIILFSFSVKCFDNFKVGHPFSISEN